MTLPAVRTSNPLVRWDPFREIDNLFGRLDRWSPLADVSETDDAYLVEVELPGVKREDIAIDLAGDLLTISGELKERERRGWFRYRTRRTGQFEYTVTLPQDVDADKIDASLEAGVLTVRAPKVESARPRRITVRGA